MVFKKGGKVEVWNRKEFPSGSWRSAEIFSVNGDIYSVRYDRCPAYNSVAVEEVPRQVIRPCPPSPPILGGLKSLTIGDAVEVFDNNSWKLAEVLEVIDRNYCEVMLLGAYRLRAHKSHIRMRLSWQDNKWVEISKGSAKLNDATLNTSSRKRKFDYPLCRLRVDMDTSAGMNGSPILSPGFPEKHSLDFQRNMKKRLPGIQIGISNHCRKKMRAIDEHGWEERIGVQCPIQSLEKVDVPFRGYVLGKKYMHSSLNNRTTASIKMKIGKEISSFDEQNCLLRHSEPSHAESTSSSVGSCCARSSPPRSQHQFLYSHSDHAESCSLQTESSLPRKELQGEIHQLELNAYRSTLIALYASGPMSWEQEALLTDMRLILNVSNDEHLLELRNLLHRKGHQKSKLLID